MSEYYTGSIRLNNASETIAMGVALPAICLIFVALRFIARYVQHAPIGIDDWLSLGGLITLIGMGVCLIDGGVNGALGWPTPEGPASIQNPLTYVDPTSVLTLKLQFVFQILMMACYGFVKLSIVFFYRRIFVVSKNSKFDIVTKVSGVMLLLWSIAYLLVDIFACGLQVDANWGSLEMQLEYCPAGYTSEYGFVATDLAMDLLVLIIPLPVIWSLHMTRLRKLAVTFIILLGVSSIAASVARTAIYIIVIDGTLAGENIDTNLSITAALWWSMLECGLALIAACLPSFSVFFARSSLQSMIASVRSAFSLHSKSSRSYDNQTSHLSYPNNAESTKSVGSSTDYDALYPGTHGVVKADGASNIAGRAKDGILVHHDIELNSKIA